MSVDLENPHNQTQVNYQNSTLYRTVLGLFRVLHGSIRLSLRILSHQQNRSAAVALERAFNYLSIVCCTVTLWYLLGVWDAVAVYAFPATDLTGSCRYLGIWT